MASPIEFILTNDTVTLKQTSEGKSEVQEQKKE